MSQYPPNFNPVTGQYMMPRRRLRRRRAVPVRGRTSDPFPESFDPTGDMEDPNFIPAPRPRPRPRPVNRDPIGPVPEFIPPMPEYGPPFPDVPSPRRKLPPRPDEPMPKKINTNPNANRRRRTYAPSQANARDRSRSTSGQNTVRRDKQPDKPKTINVSELRKAQAEEARKRNAPKGPQSKPKAKALPRRRAQAKPTPKAKAKPRTRVIPRRRAQAKPTKPTPKKGIARRRVIPRRR